MLAHGWLLVLNIAGVMGRPEQREHKRKQAAASSQRIDSLFASAAKRTKESSSVSPSTPSTENSQNAIELNYVNMMQETPITVRIPALRLKLKFAVKTRVCHLQLLTPSHFVAR